MNVLKIEQLKPLYSKGNTKATATIDGKRLTVFFDKKKAGFGIKTFFICSNCGKYCTQLAYNGKIFMCFQCAGFNPYEGIQLTTRGGWQFIAYKMRRYAEKNRVENFHFPFKYYDYERPRRHRVRKWDDVMLVLQALESMRNQSIFFGKVWNVEVIRAVERGEHEAVQPGYNALFHMEYFYPFDGNPVNLEMIKAKF